MVSGYNYLASGGNSYFGLTPGPNSESSVTAGRMSEAAPKEDASVSLEDFIISDYDQVMQFVKDPSGYEKILSALPDSENKIKEIVDLVYSPIWNLANPLFLDENYPFYVLAALQDQKISKDTFGTLIIFWSFVGYHDKEKASIPECHSFSENGSISPSMEQLLRASLRPFISYGKFLRREKDPNYRLEFLNEEQFQKLLVVIKALPLCEQHFLIVEDLQDNRQLPPFEVSTPSQSLNYHTGFNVFSRIKYVDEDQVYRVVPSIGIMKALASVICGADVMTLVPCIEGFENDSMRREFIGKRSIAMSLPFPKDPKQVQEMFCRDQVDLFYEEFYRLITSSFIPHDQRIVFADLYQVIDLESRDQDDEIEKIKSRLIYLECSTHRIFCVLLNKIASLIEAYKKKKTVDSRVIIELCLELNEVSPWRFEELQKKLPNLADFIKNPKTISAGDLNSLANGLEIIVQSSYQSGLGRDGLYDRVHLFQKALQKYFKIFHDLEVMDRSQALKFEHRIRVFASVKKYLLSLQNLSSLPKDYIKKACAPPKGAPEVNLVWELDRKPSAKPSLRMQVLKNQSRGLKGAHVLIDFTSPPTGVMTIPESIEGITRFIKSGAKDDSKKDKGDSKKGQS